MVGARGFEPPTPWSRTRCATRLRYAPNVMLSGCRWKGTLAFSRPREGQVDRRTDLVSLAEIGWRRDDTRGCQVGWSCGRLTSHPSR
jgi:hypothetical protein